MTNITPIGVSLNKTNLTLNTGSSETLTATISPSNATNKELTWSSSNTSVATVSNGKVTAVGKGTAIITVKTVNGKTAICNVTVNTALTSLNIIKKSGPKILYPDGPELILEAVRTPADVEGTVDWYCDIEGEGVTVYSNGNTFRIVPDNYIRDVVTVSAKLNGITKYYEFPMENKIYIAKENITGDAYISVTTINLNKNPIEINVRANESETPVIKFVFNVNIRAYTGHSQILSVDGLTTKTITIKSRPIVDGHASIMLEANAGQKISIRIEKEKQ